jgi:hypothetical protein
MRLAVVCEDRRHFDVVSLLVDAEALTHHDWLDGVLDHVRAWRATPEGQAPDAPYLKVSADEARWAEPSVTLPDGTKIPLQGFIDGKPAKPEAQMWRKVLAQLVTQKPRPTAVLLVRDLDGRADRREGMEQVRSKLPWPPDMPIVLATPEPEMEAWVVSGFVAEDDKERATLERLRQELSFDPTTEAHRLTSHPNDAATDAKRVLAALTQGDAMREERCLADRVQLAERGGANHCGDFLVEVRKKIVPKFTAP